MSGGGSMQVHRQFVGLGTGGSLYIARPHHSHLRLHPLYVRKGAKGVASRFSAPKYSAACYLQLTELLTSCRFSARTTLTSVLEFRYCPVPESNSQDSSGSDPFQLHFRNTLVRVEQSSRVGCLVLLNSNGDEEYKPVSFILLLYMCVLYKQWILSIDLKARAITTCELSLRLSPVGTVIVMFVTHILCITIVVWFLAQQKKSGVTQSSYI